MNPDVVQRLVYSITQFLRQQVETSNLPTSILKEEGAESVEVALQCLEAAYGVSPNSPQLDVSESLYNIFNNATEQQTKASHVNGSTAGLKEKEAEQLKNEGNILMRDGHFSEALTKYSNAIDRDQNNAVYYSNRAAALSKLDRYHEAIADCRKALEIDPNYSKAFGRMGLAYSALEQYQEARDCYKRALELEPTNTVYESNLAVAQEKLSVMPNSSGNTSAEINLGPFASMAGLDGRAPSLTSVLNNPNLLSAASQLMANPNMQTMMSSLMSGLGNVNAPASRPQTDTSTPPPATTTTTTATENSTTGQPQASAQGEGQMGMDFLLNTGRQLAELMEVQHPQLVEQLRNQMGRNFPRDDGSNPPPP